MTVIDYKMYIDGEWASAADGRTIESVNPANGRTWATFPAAAEVDVGRAVMAADRAMKVGPWSTMTPSDRGALLKRLADLLPEYADQIAQRETIDSGKLLRETTGQAKYLPNYFHYYAGLADKIEGAVLPVDKPDMVAMTVREPIGVVAAVVPWNTPTLLAAGKIGPALAAGNSVVVKPSEVAPAALLEFARAVHEAGIPPGVFNVVTGHGDTCGRALTSHQSVARVAFTGGPATARHIVQNTAENFAHVTLELGGKSPVLVFDDADVDSAIHGTVAGIFGASGQSCVAGSRLYVQRSIFEETCHRLVRRAESIKIGDPSDPVTEMGPLATQDQLRHIERSVNESLRHGAKLLTGGTRPAGLSAGTYFAPTILSFPDQDLGPMNDEMFGPVLSVAPFDSEREAVALANDSRFGLAAGVWTNDASRALRVSKNLKSGIVWVNTYRVMAPMAPFGGYQQSGNGREGGIDAIHDYTRTKTIWLNTSEEPMKDPFTMRL